MGPLGYQELVGVIGTGLTLVSFVPYIVAILRRKTVPNRVTWSVWTLAALVILSLYITSDEPIGWTILLPIMYLLGQGTTALLAFNYGVKKWTRFDIACFMLGITSIAVWLILESPLLALFTIIAADFFGALPTLVKTYNHPRTEDAGAWLLTAFGNLLILLAIPSFSVFVLTFPLYMFLVNGTIATLALRRRHNAVHYRR